MDLAALKKAARIAHLKHCLALAESAGLTKSAANFREALAAEQ